MSMDGSATARATIADSVESIKHGIFKECMVHMTACIFLLEDL
jgi:hypothetical protein